MAEDRNLNLTLLLKIPDNVIKIDTRDAEAALERLRQRAKAVLSEINSGTSGVPGPIAPGGGGGGLNTPGFSTPPASPAGVPGSFVFRPGSQGGSYYAPPGAGYPAMVPPGAPFFNPNGYATPIGPLPRPIGPWGMGASAIYPQGAATLLTGPWYGGVNTLGLHGRGSGQRDGFSYGPVSDPGSYARSSLTTGRGYDQAMLRPFAEQARSLQSYDANLQQLARTMTRVREGAIGLAAGMVVLNKSFEPGSGFDSPGMAAIGGLMALESGGRLASAIPGMARTGAGLASKGFGAAAGYFGGTLAARGLTAAGSYFGGMATTTTLMGLASRAWGPIAIAATAAKLGHDLYAAHSDNNAAIATGQGLDAQIAAMNYGRSMWDDAAPIRNAAMGRFGAANTASLIGMRYGGGAIDFAQAQSGLMGVLGDLRSHESSLGGVGGAAGDAAASREKLQNLAQQRQVLEEMVRTREQENRKQAESLELSRRSAEAEQDKARAAGMKVGGISGRDWRRGVAFYGRAMSDGTLSDREAERLAGMGFGDSRAVEDFYRRRGSQRADGAEAAGIVGLLPSESRTSKQIAELEAKIKESEAEIKRLPTTMAAFAETVATAVADVNAKFGEVSRQLMEVKFGVGVSQQRSNH